MPNTRYLPELSKKEMLELLDEERVGRLGLNDEPQPYVVPTDFAYKDFVLRQGKPGQCIINTNQLNCPTPQGTNREFYQIIRLMHGITELIADLGPPCTSSPFFPACR